jgi:hypothetical protein
VEASSGEDPGVSSPGYRPGQRRLPATIGGCEFRKPETGWPVDVFLEAYEM